MISVGDLVVVAYPAVEWDWLRYKMGDIGIVLDKTVYPDYCLVKIKVFRTGKIEPIPESYLYKLEKKC